MVIIYLSFLGLRKGGKFPVNFRNITVIWNLPLIFGKFSYFLPLCNPSLFRTHLTFFLPHKKWITVYGKVIFIKYDESEWGLGRSSFKKRCKSIINVGNMTGTRDVTINREPVENRLIYVTIQIGWDAKQITIQLEVVYMNVCLRGTYRL